MLSLRKPGVGSTGLFLYLLLTKVTTIGLNHLNQFPQYGSI